MKSSRGENMEMVAWKFDYKTMEPGFMGIQVDFLGRRYCCGLSHPVCTHKLGDHHWTQLEASGRKWC